MNSIFKKFETAMVAAAFAEEGEFETARQIIKESESDNTNQPAVCKYRKLNGGEKLTADCNGA